MAIAPAKRCRDCGIEKPVTAFNRHAQCRLGVQPMCKKCQSVKGKAEYNAKKEAVAAKRKEKYYANIEAKRAGSRRRARKWIAANRELCRANTKKWRNDNPDKALALYIARRTREANAIVEVFSREEIWERDGGICYICQKPCDRDDWHLDHIIPLIKGGLHARSNVGVSHSACNLSKATKMPEEVCHRIS